MISYQLVEVKTRDQLIHQGIFFTPEKKTKPSFVESQKTSAGRRALLWVHGLTSTFYGNTSVLNALAAKCQETGYGFASFNNRGHDIITGTRKYDKREAKGYRHLTTGSAFEDFSESIFDVEAGINFLVAQGFEEVVVVGHSTGANKVCYYTGKRTDPNVAAVALLGPLSDRLNVGVDSDTMRRLLAKMQRLITKGEADILQHIDGFFPMTPARFLSIYTIGSIEDQFDYGETKPRLFYFKKIKKPLLVVIGAQDEYLDRPVENVLSVFNKYTKSKNYKSVALADSFHSFRDKEQELTKTIFAWLDTIGQ